MRTTNRRNQPEKGKDKSKERTRMDAEKEDVSVGLVITKKGEVTIKLDLRSRWTYVLLTIIAGLAGSPTLMAAATKLLHGG